MLFVVAVIVTSPSAIPVTIPHSSTVAIVFEDEEKETPLLLAFSGVIV